MRENSVQLKSIWGTWWEPIRKWFYPIWLIYETSVRFYDYGLSVYYLIFDSNTITSSLGSIGTEILALFCSIITFAICSIYLTVPACFILYKFFHKKNITNTQFEDKLKPIF